MKKRLILALCSVVFLVGVISGCSEDKKTTNTGNQIVNYSIFETKEKNKYLSFLNELDSSKNYEVVDISNSAYAFSYTGPHVLYSITYKVTSEAGEENIQYEYFLFETEEKNDYLSFLDELGTEYEVLDCSVAKYSLGYTGPHDYFIVTYRKAK